MMKKKEDDDKEEDGDKKDDEEEDNDDKEDDEEDDDEEDDTIEWVCDCHSTNGDKTIPRRIVLIVDLTLIKSGASHERSSLTSARVDTVSRFDAGAVLCRLPCRRSKLSYSYLAIYVYGMVTDDKHLAPSVCPCSTLSS